MNLKEQFKEGHLIDYKDHQLGICVCSMGFGKSLIYRGHKYKSVEEMMKGETQ